MKTSKQPHTVRLGTHEVGDGKPTYIILEGGLTNWGELDLAERQVDAAMAAGADCVKFQAQTTEELVSKKVDPYWYRRLKYKELSHDDLLELRDYVAVRNIDFLVTAHTETDLDFLDKKLGLEFFKVGSGESLNMDFLKNVGSRGKPVVMSLGLHLTDEEIRQSTATLENAGAKEIVILHCNTVYPTPYEINDLGQIAKLKSMFGYPIGYSDHTVGLHVPIAAVALGAHVIEKHISFDTRDKRSFDCPGSVTPETAKDFVDQIRQVEVAMKVGGAARRERILAARNWARQSIVARGAIKKGSVIKPSQIALKRPGVGLGLDEITRVVGKRASKAIADDELICPEDLQS